MEDSEIKRILEEVRTIAVVGLSPDTSKPSNRVSASLKHWGYRIIPVNPSASEACGERCWPNLAFIPERVDLVLVFRRSEHAAMILAETSVRGVPNVWFQPGTSTDNVAALSERRRVGCVTGRCIQQEYLRLIYKDE